MLMLTRSGGRRMRGLIKRCERINNMIKKMERYTRLINKGKYLLKPGRSQRLCVPWRSSTARVQKGRLMEKVLCQNRSVPASQQTEG